MVSSLQDSFYNVDVIGLNVTDVSSGDNPAEEGEATDDALTCEGLETLIDIQQKTYERIDAGFLMLSIMLGLLLGFFVIYLFWNGKGD